MNYALRSSFLSARSRLRFLAVYKDKVKYCDERNTHFTDITFNGTSSTPLKGTKEEKALSESEYSIICDEEKPLQMTFIYKGQWITKYYYYNFSIDQVIDVTSLSSAVMKILEKVEIIISNGLCWMILYKWHQHLSLDIPLSRDDVIWSVPEYWI